MKTLVASVGVVRLFDPSNNALICTANTCTTTGINLGVTAEEARGGQGNMLLGKYYHDTSFGLNIEDQLFDLEYLALNCGGQITAGGNVITTEQITVGAEGAVVVSATPVALGTSVVGWAKKPSESDEQTKTLTFNAETKTAESTYTEGDIVCVTYFTNVASARSFKVSSTFIPAVVHAVMTVPLFKAGTNGQIDTGASKVGELIVDVPQLQLEGAQELSLTASGISSTSLSGSALATFTAVDSCSADGYYAIITENIYGKDEFDDVYAVVIEDSDVDLKVDETQKLVVIALHNGTTAPSVISADKLTFTSDNNTVATISNAGLVEAKAVGSTNVEAVVTGHTDLVATARVTVTNA